MRGNPPGPRITRPAWAEGSVAEAHRDRLCPRPTRGCVRRWWWAPALFRDHRAQQGAHQTKLSVGSRHIVIRRGIVGSEVFS